MGRSGAGPGSHVAPLAHQKRVAQNVNRLQERDEEDPDPTWDSGRGADGMRCAGPAVRCVGSAAWAFVAAWWWFAVGVCAGTGCGAGGRVDPSGVVAVVMVHARPERLATQVGAILGGTCVPGRVWVAALGGSGHARGTEMREALRGVEEAHGRDRVRFVESSAEMGVVARLDVGAAVARSADFVWHLDDDQLPGPGRLQCLLEAAGRPEFQGAACFSGHGWAQLPEDGVDYRARGAWHDGRTSSEVTELRVGCGSWFLNASHAERVLGADPPFRVPRDALEHNTGEDIVLAWRLRAALGVRTYALPEAGRPECTANAAPQWGLDGRQLTGPHNPHAMAARERLIAAMNAAARGSAPLSRKDPRLQPREARAVANSRRDGAL